MVITSYNTLFAASPASGVSRSTSAFGTRSIADAENNLRNRDPDRQGSRAVAPQESGDQSASQNFRKVDNVAYSEPSAFFTHGDYGTDNATQVVLAVEKESADQYHKVQTFLQIREFEVTPQIIDTFV